MSGPGATLLPTNTTAPEAESGLEAGNARLRQEVENHNVQLECVLDAEASLEAEAQTLRERVRALEPRAAVADHWRRWSKELEGRFEHATHTAETIRQAAVQLHQKFESERVTRQRAEAEAARLQGELERWRQQGEQAQQEYLLLDMEVKQLRPMAGWLVEWRRSWIVPAST